MPYIIFKKKFFHLSCNLFLRIRGIKHTDYKIKYLAITLWWIKYEYAYNIYFLWYEKTIWYFSGYAFHMKLAYLLIYDPCNIIDSA